MPKHSLALLQFKGITWWFSLYLSLSHHLQLTGEEDDPLQKAERLVLSIDSNGAL